MPETVFIAGATGYMGARLAERLIRGGHRVRALARAGSVARLPAGCEPVIGDALDPATYAPALPGCGVFVQLVGVAHPNPLKASDFERIDAASGRGAVRAAKAAGVPHFVYVSVAQPAPVMRAYVNARASVEEEIREAGLNATVLRPWYVLGPGHRWPLLAAPIFWLLPPRFGFVTIDQMTDALTRAVESHPAGIRIWDVAAIRRGGTNE